jgi:hypothetical protein
MRTRRKIFALLLMIAGTATLESRALWAMPAQIVLLRHAEKPPTGDHLSDQGWKRAHALPSLFEREAELHRLGSPAALYAMKPKSDDEGSVRAIETLQPLAEKFHLRIRSPFERKEISELVETVENSRKLDGKMVVIAWEHKKIPDIAEKFGVKKPPDWKDVYDRVWVLDYDAHGRLERFQDLPQKLLPGDSTR